MDSYETVFVERSSKYKGVMAHLKFNHLNLASVGFCVLVYKIVKTLFFSVKTIVKHLSICKFLSSKLHSSDKKVQALGIY